MCWVWSPGSTGVRFAATASIMRGTVTAVTLAADAVPSAKAPAPLLPRPSPPPPQAARCGALPAPVLPLPAVLPGPRLRCCHPRVSGHQVSSLQAHGSNRRVRTGRASAPHQHSGGRTYLPSSLAEAYAAARAFTRPALAAVPTTSATQGSTTANEPSNPTACPPPPPPSEPPRHHHCPPLPCLPAF